MNLVWSALLNAWLIRANTGGTSFKSDAMVRIINDHLHIKKIEKLINEQDNKRYLFERVIWETAMP